MLLFFLSLNNSSTSQSELSQDKVMHQTNMIKVRMEAHFMQEVT